MTEEAAGKLVEDTVPVEMKKTDTQPRSKAKAAAKKPSKRKAKKTRKTARVYPGKTLEDCVKVVEAIKTQNAGNPWPPDEIAKAIRIKSRSSNLAEIIRSSTLYGLVEGSYRGAAISLAEPGRRLAYPPSDDELQSARREALLSVDLFKRVIQHYKGGAIPDSPFINNTLTREFGLGAEFHDEFLKILRKNIEYVEGTPASSLIELGPIDAKAPSKVHSSGAAKGKLRAFVIMPFVEQKEAVRSDGFFKEVYASIIKPACEQAGFEAITADRKGSDIIHATILREILEADIVVADLTDHNPNVMFELGLRMAFGKKPVAIIKSKDTGRVFDVDNVLRVHEYSQNLWTSTVGRDIPELAEHIKATWDARSTGSSYVEILTGRSGSQQSG